MTHLTVGNPVMFDMRSEDPSFQPRLAEIIGTQKNKNGNTLYLLSFAGDEVLGFNGKLIDAKFILPVPADFRLGDPRNTNPPLNDYDGGARKRMASRKRKASRKQKTSKKSRKSKKSRSRKD